MKTHIMTFALLLLLLNANSIFSINHAIGLGGGSISTGSILYRIAWNDTIQSQINFYLGIGFEFENIIQIGGGAYYVEIKPLIYKLYENEILKINGLIMGDHELRKISLVLPEFEFDLLGEKKLYLTYNLVKISYKYIHGYFFIEDFLNYTNFEIVYYF